MHVCMYVCRCVCMFSLSLCLSARLPVCHCVSMRMRMHMCMCMCICASACMYAVYVYVFPNNMCVCMYVCMVLRCTIMKCVRVCVREAICAHRTDLRVRTSMLVVEITGIKNHHWGPGASMQACRVSTKPARRV